MNCKIIALTLISLLVYSCYQESVSVKDVVTDSCEEISIPDSFSRNQRLEDLISDLCVIQLETSNESILSDIEKIIITKDNIYVYDIGTTRGPAIFDIHGNFKKRLSNGQAPQDIGATKNIYYDTYKNYFCVYDAVNHKIAKFSEDGEFVECHYLNFLLNDMVIEDNYIFAIQAYYQNPYEKLTFIKEDSISTTTSLWWLNREKFKISKTYYLQQYGNGININVPYESNLYYYQNDTVKVKYRINSKSKLDLTTYENEWDMLKDIKSGEYIYAGECIESTNFLYLKYVTKAEIGPVSAYVLRNKTTNEMIFINHEAHLLSSLAKVHCIQIGQKDCLVGVIDPICINNHPNPDFVWDGSNPNNLLSPEDMEKLRNVKPDDNPIIVLFKLKDEI